VQYSEGTRIVSDVTARPGAPGPAGSAQTGGVV